jgi:hypothetical protein
MYQSIPLSWGERPVWQACGTLLAQLGRPLGGPAAYFEAAPTSGTECGVCLLYYPGAQRSEFRPLPARWDSGQSRACVTRRLSLGVPFCGAGGRPGRDGVASGNSVRQLSGQTGLPFEFQID